MVFSRVGIFNCNAIVSASLFSKNNSKRAQRDAGSAANLVAFIGLFLILYILFVPPAERDLLLSGDSRAPSGGEDDGFFISSLINTQPGQLHYFFEDEFEHHIPSFMLKQTQYSEEIVTENSFVVRRSWFSNQPHSISFPLSSVRDAVRVFLTFSVEGSPRGNLLVYLNGKQLINREYSRGLINPLEIPVEYLSSQNVLEFHLSPPGVLPWAPNRYQIVDLGVAGDFIDASTLDNSHTFFLSELEQERISDSRLIFSPTCNRNDVGRLSIFINGHSVFSAIPDCNTLNRVNFLPDILDRENVISFSSAKGDYMISLANIRTQVSDKDYPRYYFELTDSTYNKIRDGTQYIKLSIDLQDDDRFKEAYILVNSVKFFLNTRTNSYERRIPYEVLEKGTNSLQIQPLNSFHAVRLKVEIFEN